MAHAAKRLAQALGLLFATFAVAEGTLRLIDLPPPPLVAPPHDVATVSLNRLGLREPWDEPPARESGELRVVVLGDSFVFGEGLSRAESLPVRLEAELAQRFSGRRVRVFNLGFPGADVFEEARRYAPLHDALAPDLLLLVVYLNDLSPEMPARLLDELYGAGERGTWLERSSWVVGHIVSRVRRRSLRGEILAHYRDSTLRELPRLFPAIARQLIDLRHFVETDGVAFHLALFPWLVQLDDYPLDAVHAHVARFAEEEAFSFLDLVDVFRGGDGEALRVAPADEHPGAAAVALAAGALADFLQPALAGRGRDRAPVAP